MPHMHRCLNYWTCNDALDDDLLPLCPDIPCSKCFMQTYESEVEKSDILLKPCTKVQYYVRETVSVVDSHVDEFELTFTKPPEVLVKEEYLIFDSVAMISSIGGTLGLCIGFSFMDITGALMAFLKRILARNQNEDNRVGTVGISESVKVQPCMDVDQSTGTEKLLQTIEKMDMRLTALEDRK